MHCHLKSLLLSQASAEGGEAGLEAELNSRQSAGQQQPVRDASEVMACLKRGLKIADAAQNQLNMSRKTQDTTPMLLYVEVLNKYLYYFDQELPKIGPDELQVITSPCDVSFRPA